MSRFGGRVAVIGGGPSGLVAARYLKAHGFDPVIYEQSNDLGGQWKAGSDHSGVWPDMRANTSRAMTRFSDLDYPMETESFPGSDEVHAYLERYGEAFGLANNMRLNTEVETVARHPTGGWAVHSRSAGAASRTDIFSRVVIATGRFSRPAQPSVPGLDGFSGAGGVIHSFDYSGPEAFKGKTVLVAGCSSSALEIATAIVKGGAALVISTMRRQRYVLRKRIAGVPTDQIALNRFSAVAGECRSKEIATAELRDFIVRTCGDPVQSGAPRPAADLSAAGIAISDDYLDLVGAGRIVTRPWMERVDGRAVHFGDGSAAEVDAVVLGTGYAVDFPFLDLRTRKVLGFGLRGCSLDLYNFTFHPDLKGLAFLGFFPLVGPYFPVLELQARWMSYVWAGLVPEPSMEVMRADLRSAEGTQQEPLAHDMTLLFAREAGVEPELSQRPGLARALLFGPLSPVSFRLCGPDALPGAGWDVMTEAARAGAITTPVLTDEERRRIATLVQAGRTDLAWLVRGYDAAQSEAALKAA